MRMLIPGLVFALAMPATAFAQKAAPPRWTISPRTGPASDGWPRDPLPRFTIPPRGTVGLPLPETGLPLPPIGLQTPHGPRRGHGRYHWPAYGWPAVVYYVPWYEPYPFSREAAAIPVPAPVEQPTPTGRLILGPQPDGAQVFVDGYYAGITDDFSVVHGGGVLEAGQHRIEVSAPGYESLSIDVRIASNQSVTYRGTLKRIPPPVAKSAPMTFYLIPGCYMGNVPPKDARLPASCDLGRVVEFKY